MEGILGRIRVCWWWKHELAMMPMIEWDLYLCFDVEVRLQTLDIALVKTNQE